MSEVYIVKSREHSARYLSLLPLSSRLHRTRWSNGLTTWVPQVTSWVVTLTPEHGMVPISKGLVRESINMINRKCCLMTPIQAYLTENHSCTQSYILYNYHTSRVTHASLLLQVGLLHVGLLQVGRHNHWRWDNISPTYLHMSYSKPDTLLLALGQH